MSIVESCLLHAEVRGGGVSDTQQKKCDMNQGPDSI